MCTGRACRESGSRALESPQESEHHSRTSSPGRWALPQPGTPCPHAEQHIPHVCMHTDRHTHPHSHTHVHRGPGPQCGTLSSRHGIFMKSSPQLRTSSSSLSLCPAHLLVGPSGWSHWEGKHWRLGRESKRMYCVLLTNPHGTIKSHTRFLPQNPLMSTPNTLSVQASKPLSLAEVSLLFPLYIYHPGNRHWLSANCVLAFLRTWAQACSPPDTWTSSSLAGCHFPASGSSSSASVFIC